MKIYATSRQGVYSALGSDGHAVALIVNTRLLGRWHVYRVKRGTTAAGFYHETWCGAPLADVTHQLHGAQDVLIQTIEKAINHPEPMCGPDDPAPRIVAVSGIECACATGTISVPCHLH